MDTDIVIEDTLDVSEVPAGDQSEVKSDHDEVISQKISIQESDIPVEEDETSQRISMQNNEEDAEPQRMSKQDDEEDKGSQKLSFQQEDEEKEPQIASNQFQDETELSLVSFQQDNEEKESQRVSNQFQEEKLSVVSFQQDNEENEQRVSNQFEEEKKLSHLSFQQDDEENEPQRVSNQFEEEKKLSRVSTAGDKLDEGRLSIGEMGPKLSLLSHTISIDDDEDKISTPSQREARQSNLADMDKMLPLSPSQRLSMQITDQDIIESPTEELVQSEKASVVEVLQEGSEKQLDSHEDHLIASEVISESKKSTISGGGEPKRSTIYGEGYQPVGHIKSIEDVNNLIKDRSSLINWCIKMGLIIDGQNCPNCNGLTNWEVQSDHRLYWVCTSSEPTCRNACVKAKIPFNCQGLTLNKMALLLFMVYSQHPLNDIVADLGIRKDDYESFENTFREACIHACKKTSGSIGGENKHVNVEVGARMGRNKPDQVVIGGIEDDDSRKIYFGQIPPDKSIAQLKTHLKRKILPESLVNSNTADRGLIESMSWSYSDSWTLKYNSGCLAEDLWRQHLVGDENEFEALAQTISEYFVHHRSKHL